jgi:hypothetical protein
MTTTFAVLAVVNPTPLSLGPPQCKPNLACWSCTDDFSERTKAAPQGQNAEQAKAEIARLERPVRGNSRTAPGSLRRA